MILRIQTQELGQTKVQLYDINQQLLDEKISQNQRGSQVLLPAIEALLAANSIDYGQLTAIEVETGPGSYTGIRVGVTVANALGFSLGIPVNNKAIETEIVYN